jgi:methyl-accepting chemotaxis protein
MLCDKIISKIPSIAIFFVAILFSMVSFIGSNFEQSEGMNQTYMESTNQTLQNMSQTTNQTLQNMSQTTNQTLQNMSQTINNTAGEAILQKNSTDLGSNLTEVAKKLAKSIDEGIKNINNISKAKL